MYDLRSIQAQSLTNEPQVYNGVEVLLHPRLPPLMRALPPVEALSLFRAEKSQEENDECRALGIVGADVDVEPDVVMAEPPPTRIEIIPDVVLAQPPPPARLQTPIPSVSPQHPLKPPQSLASRNSEAPAPIHRQPVSPIKAVHEPPIPILVEEEKNEEMPAIDLGSDSEDE